MKGAISLDSVTPYTYPGGRGSWLVVCGECKGRAMQYDAGNRERADFCRPWLVDESEESARKSLRRHDGLHHRDGVPD